MQACKITRNGSAFQQQGLLPQPFTCLPRRLRRQKKEESGEARRCYCTREEAIRALLAPLSISCQGIQISVYLTGSVGRYFREELPHGCSSEPLGCLSRSGFGYANSLVYFRKRFARIPASSESFRALVFPPSSFRTLPFFRLLSSCQPYTQGSPLTGRHFSSVKVWQSFRPGCLF